MDIHRCRFVPYNPQAITALAFSHASNPNEKAPSSLRLALGRSDGNIEIWNPLGGRWVQESILRGKTGTTIEQLVWTQETTLKEDGSVTIAEPGKLRLFSSEGSSVITEWDLARGTPKRRADGNVGDIWCLAAQPAYQVDATYGVDDQIPGQMLAAGCRDGRIILFSTGDDNLSYSHVVMAASAKRRRPLSITWRDRSTIVAGFQNGTITVINVNERRAIRTMTLGRPTDGDKSLVWAVKCLPDGTILSGDAGGELKIWDANTLSLLQRMKTHQADILDVVSNAKGDMIFTVGVDRRTVAYKPLPLQKGGKVHRWAKSFHRRYHENDIKCAAAYESKGMSVLVTGGIDCSPVVLPLRNWQYEYHRTLPALPQKQQISVSRRARILAAWWQNTVVLYQIARRNATGEVAASEPPQSKDYQMVSTIQLSEDDYIQSACLSHDGRLLALCTSRGIKIFQLRKTVKEGQLIVRMRPLELPAYLHKFGARHVAFSPNDRWLCVVRLDNTIVLSKVTASEDPKMQPDISLTPVRLTPRSIEDDVLEGYTENVSCITFSPDSRALAVGDLSGYVNTWVLEGHEDLDYIESKNNDDSDDSSSSSSDSDSDSEDDSIIIHGQKWIRYPSDSRLPRLDSAILAISFRPSPTLFAQSIKKTNIGLHPTRHNPHPVAHELPTTDMKLLAISASHNLVEFDLLTGKFSDWSRRNPSSHLPYEFKQVKDRIMGCFFDQQQRLFMYGPNWIYMLDLSNDLPGPKQVGKLGYHIVQEPSETATKLQQSPQKKRKRGTGAGDSIKELDRDVGYGSFAVKHKGDEAMKLVQLDDRMSPISDDEDGVSSNALVKLRRQELNGHVEDQDTEMVNGDMTQTDDRNGELDMTVEESHAQAQVDTDQNAVTVKSKQTRLREWHSFSYRSIFGICPINEESEPLEVVLIERPMHDVNLPPRFQGGQEWET